MMALEHEIDHLRDLNAELVEALRFYAPLQNYVPDQGGHPPALIMQDAGAKARAAIAKAKMTLEQSEDLRKALLAELKEARALNAELSDRVRYLTKLLDDQMGTPCEQMRHAEQMAELVEALEGPLLSNSVVYHSPEVLARVRAAIAKAKGEK